MEEDKDNPSQKTFLPLASVSSVPLPQHKGVFPKFGGYLSGGPYNKEDRISGSILGSPDFRETTRPRQASYRGVSLKA